MISRPFPISVMVFGKLILISLMQPANAPSSISSTVSGSITLFNVLHHLNTLGKNLILAKEGKISKSFAEEFIQQAIDRCIEEGILADYLRQYKKEVLSMIFESYDLQKHLEVNNLDHQKEIDELKSEISELTAELAEKDILTATNLILGNVSDELIIKVAHITPEKLKELKLQLKK